MHHVASWLRFLGGECDLRGYVQGPRSQFHWPEREEPPLTFWVEFWFFWFHWCIFFSLLNYVDGFCSFFAVCKDLEPMESCISWGLLFLHIASEFWPNPDLEWVFTSRSQIVSALWGIRQQLERQWNQLEYLLSQAARVLFRWYDCLMMGSYVGASF